MEIFQGLQCEGVRSRKVSNVVFKKKEPKLEVNSETIEADIQEKKEIEKISEEDEKRLKELISEYRKYTTAYDAGDIINLPSGMIETEKLNLLFSIFCELKELNTSILYLIKTVEDSEK